MGIPSRKRESQVCLRVGCPGVKRCYQADNKGVGRGRTLPSWNCLLRHAESVGLGQGLYAAGDEVMIDPADVIWLEELLDQVYRSLAK